MPKVFIDTNILVYTLDRNDPDKQDRARDVMRKMVTDHRPVISVQVAQEFFVVATKKLNVDSIAVKALVHSFRNIEIVLNDLDVVEQAIDIGLVSRLAFWDSMIVAAAEKANCSIILSEDMGAGQSYRGIRVVNPFVMEF